MSYMGQYNLMDPSSIVQVEMTLFHDHALMIILSIFTFVSLMGFLLMKSHFSSRRLHEAQKLETFWTLFPALLLIILGLPSLRNLYMFDEQPMKSENTLKVTGHQWYWSYESELWNNKSFDSYMIMTNNLSSGDYRLLEVDNRVMVPSNIHSMISTTSMDVIHAWTMPSLGIKMDSVPGRLNMSVLFPLMNGVYYGQCSEICGANHAFMPIALESVPLMIYYNTLYS
uniref:cytochrome c oxidase subunit II n=1 Tax=Cochlostyla marinduquensis TaxID=2079772 RepID=UPI00233EF635|nr:cytochrome c oxidase subunit II [Cochlostyla marinduquensis]UIX22052.1 cytochrome c oxidase subunit 2 [Cochlostyla marinduquensis]